MATKKHLPVYGVGPLYGITINLLTIIGMLLSRMEFLQFANFKVTKIPVIIIGILILLYGFMYGFELRFELIIT